MTTTTDRRSVLIGLGALGAAGCSPSPASEAVVAEAARVAPGALSHD